MAEQLKSLTAEDKAALKDVALRYKEFKTEDEVNHKKTYSQRIS